jgi:hypothetical protein
VIFVKADTYSDTSPNRNSVTHSKTTFNKHEIDSPQLHRKDNTTSRQGGFVI